MFKGKTAVVTGAGSGIGRALAIQLAKEGANLALSDLNGDGLAETIEEITRSDNYIINNIKVKGYILDVSDRGAVFDHSEDVLNDFGAVHLVFNNAGVTLVGTVAHTSIEEFEWQVGINLWGVVYVTKAFLPAMTEQREGVIVNISSVFGLLSFSCQGAYSMSKFAVRGFTECLWSELEGTGVRAVSVHPGGIKTNIEKAGRRVKNAGEEENILSQAADKMLTTPPEECAAEILSGVKKGDRRIITGNKSTTLFWLTRLFPNSYPRILRMLT